MNVPRSSCNNFYYTENIALLQKLLSHLKSPSLVTTFRGFIKPHLEFTYIFK